VRCFVLVPLLTVGLAAATATRAAAGDFLSLGAREPPPTIFDHGGYDTANATAKARFTSSEIQTYCMAWNKPMPGCVAGIRETWGAPNRVFSVRADCKGGNITDIDGTTYVFAGIWPAGSLGSGRTMWRGPDGSIVGDWTSAEGLRIATNWEAVCPKYGRSGPASQAQLVTATATAEETDDDPPFLPDVSPEDEWDHNGSIMKVDRDAGIIRYLRPKPSLAGTVTPGTVVFEGIIEARGGAVKGLAYTFKKGCAPAPYRVSGFYNPELEWIQLEGAAPIRRGCAIVGYDGGSGHAELRFSRN
jgi:hypothetical protein